VRTSTGAVIGLGGVVVLLLLGGGVASVILLSVNAARERARRMQCGNNTKQLMLGLQNYHDTFLYLPNGARNRTTKDMDGKPSWGPSWLVATLPFCDQQWRFNRLTALDAADPANDYASDAMLQLEHRQMIKYFVCQSSPLPEWQNLRGHELVVPSYAGIMGATDEIPPSAPSPLQDRPDAVTPTRQEVKDEIERVVAGPYNGFAAGNGMLLINESLTFAACTDGTANTIVVGEVSDFYFDDSGAKRNPALSTADSGDGAADAVGGWLAGNNLGLIPKPENWPGRPDSKINHIVFKKGPAIPQDRVFNLITIHHPVGTNNQASTQDKQPNWGTEGIGRCGLNNPLLSAHPGGAVVGYLDGHVQLLQKQTDTWIIRRLAIRDDGGFIPAEFL
jgi:prepilin-type processing-associated H-X9-DG protein